MKLDFVCIGAQKAGTTTLHDILKNHPDIYLPKQKEAHFFDQEERFEKGTTWWWNNFFSDGYNQEKIVGVITPEYLYYDEVPQRIYEQLGSNTKIIIVLRNPIDRAFSHYLMSKRRNYENLSFEEAIDKESQRIKNGEFERNHFSYIDRGRYMNQLERYYALFKKENILTLIFEKEIKRNLDKTIIKIEEFLNVESIALKTNIKSNPASTPRSERFNSFLFKENRIRNFFGRFFKSAKLRYKIKNFIAGANLKETKNKPDLPYSQRKSLFKKYYKKELSEIETLVGRNLRIWDEMNSK